MDKERELWACALIIMSKHGAKAPAYVAERISALELAGDRAGVAAWKLIAGRVGELIELEGGEPVSDRHARD